MSKPRIAFFGTPWIAMQCLEELSKLNVDIPFVISQPDKQKDRKGNIVNCDVKKFCIANDITIYQPEKIGDIYEDVANANLDLILTCAYGQFVPEKILSLPKYGCVNLHASLLPKLRGGAPIHWSIINGEEKTGVTLMYMVKQMDAGNIICVDETPILDTDTYDSLLIKVANCARNIIKNNLLETLSKNVKSIPQDESGITFGYNIKKEDELINFNKSCKLVNCQIRGLHSKPMAKMNYKNKIFKVFESEISQVKSSTKPGTINKISNEGIFISTIDFDIIIKKIQAPNKNAVEIKQLINGEHDFLINTIVNEVINNG
ncbi:MAG: methionyl-tRNA formyltransferase [Mycoplasma sp.]